MILSSIIIVYFEKGSAHRFIDPRIDSVFINVTENLKYIQGYVIILSGQLSLHPKSPDHVCIFNHCESIRRNQMGRGLLSCLYDVRLLAWGFVSHLTNNTRQIWRTAYSGATSTVKEGVNG